ncbi:hypothetical protein PHJA_001070800 [Phtheirospermum japonicum]|uniref:Uncharacterized protein n=1 Tax=Phtheirospermum japonicum TaxID=374723 RepID=A0A830C4Q9_9LAMI|nr:hypothetical protein PHJA_001070800 [Phtheirospermum japonicum]
MIVCQWTRIGGHGGRGKDILLVIFPIIKTQFKSADYEMQRLRNIKENRRRMEDLGIKTLAYKAWCFIKEQNSHKTSKIKSKNDAATDNEYIPCEEGEQDKSNEENDDQGMIQQKKIDEQENFNQVERVSGQGKKEQRACMVNEKTLAADKPLKDSADLRPITNHQDRVVERNASKKNAQIKTLISPGSLGAYVRMKKNPRVQEQLSDGFPKKPILVRNFSSLDQRTESSEKRQVSYSQDQLFDDDSGFGLVPLKAKKTRGPSLCKDVHDLTANNRLPIILNGSGQPIGPDKSTHSSVAEEVHYSRGSNPNNKDTRTGSSVPGSHLKDLLNYWNLEEVQEQAEGKPPTLALMYMETHKRTPGKNYKTAEVNIEQLEYKDQKLLGRCSKKAKGHSKSSVIIPDEFLQPYRDEIVKDTIAGVLKMLEHLPSDVDEDGDGEANEDGDLYENLEN